MPPYPKPQFVVSLSRHFPSLPPFPPSPSFGSLFFFPQKETIRILFQFSPPFAFVVCCSFTLPSWVWLPFLVLLALPRVIRTTIRFAFFFAWLPCKDLRSWYCTKEAQQSRDVARLCCFPFFFCSFQRVTRQVAVLATEGYVSFFTFSSWHLFFIQLMKLCSYY